FFVRVIDSSSISSAKIIIVIFPVNPSHASIQCRVRRTLSITRHIHNQLRIQPSIYKRRLSIIDTQRVSTDTSNHHGRSTKLDIFHDHRGSCVDSIPRFHLQSDIDHLQLGTTAIDANGNATMALVRPTYVWITVRLALCDHSCVPFYRQLQIFHGT
ncbi:hypothetical protein EDD22DRAFT_920995, partial [Suillus occidentalis]